MKFVNNINMRKYKFFILIVSILNLYSCENKNLKTEDSEIVSSSEKQKNNCSCLETYKGDARFFDNEFVSEFTENNPAKVEKAGSGKYIYYTASWKKENKPYFLTLESLQTLDELKKQYEYVFKDRDMNLVDYVKRTYRNQTDEETEKNAKILNEQSEKNQSDLDKDGKKVKDKLQNTLLEMEQNAYTEISELGDYAVYNNKSNDLYVVCGNVLFQIRGQVGPWGKVEKEKGLELAIKASRKMINLCL